MVENDHPLSTWIGVVSGDDLSTSDDPSRNGRPQEVKVQTWELASRPVVCSLPQLREC